MRGLKGKVAAVTGAGSGIGQAVAKRLAEEGCKVAILEWKEAAAADTLKQIRDKGGEAIVAVADVGNEDQVKAAFDKVKAAYGRLDILVSNAGVFSAEIVRTPFDTENGSTDAVGA